MQTINDRTTKFFKQIKQLTQDHYGWLKNQRIKQSVSQILDQSRSGGAGDSLTTKNTLWESPNSLFIDGAAGKNSEVQKRRQTTTSSQMSSGMKQKRGKVMNDLFLSMLGDEALVQPILSNQKDKKGQRQSLRESLQTLERIAQSQPSSPMKRSDHKNSSKIISDNKVMKEFAGSTVLSTQPMYQGTEADTQSNTSVLKIVNDSNDVTPVTPYEENQGGIFASLKAVFTGGVFSRTDQKKQERNACQLEDSIVIEKKSSEEEEKSGEKKRLDLDGICDDEQEEGLPQTVECEDYAYQSSGEGDEEETELRGKLGIGRQQNESVDLLNEAQINSKPISMNVLDELENFWEKTEASQGKKGILAEHIMERQAQDIKNGNESKGHGAFCM